MASGFTGVCLRSRTNRWEACVTLSGKRYFCGTHEGEGEAARAYDKKARKLGIEEEFLNFPHGHSRSGPPPRREKAIGAAGFRGVTARGERYGAQVKSAGKHISIGCFDTAEEAARAYDAKARELGKPEVNLNFPRGEQAPAAATALPNAAQPPAGAATLTLGRHGDAATKRGRAVTEDVSEDEPSEMTPGPMAEEALAVWAEDAETAGLPRLRILLRQADAREARRSAQRATANAAAAAVAASLHALDAADAGDAPVVARMRERIRALERSEAHQRRQRDAERARREAEALAQRAAAAQAKAAELAAAVHSSDDSDSVVTRPMDDD